MHPVPSNHLAAPLWQYNRTLLQQAIGMIERLLQEATPGFDYAQAVGPHVRHILEHYQALLVALASGGCVDYDARSRNLGVQTDPAQTLTALKQLTAQFNSHAMNHSAELNSPLTTRLKAGELGQLTLTVPTSLGRELLFLASHTVHHYALLAHYCRAAGVDLGHDFGKASATIAFERVQASEGAMACA